MKTRLFFFISLLLFSLTAFSYSKTVVDYYNELVACLPGFSGNKIYYSNGTWFTTSDARSQIPVKIVDFRNGYIKFIDSSMGNGSVSTEIVLFRNAKGEYFIGISNCKRSGTYKSYGIIMFFQFTKEGRFEVTQDITSKINIYSFINPKVFKKLKRQESFLSKHVFLHYKFPRLGTTVYVTIEYEKIFTLSDNLYNRKKKIVNLFLKNIINKKLALRYEDKTGKFKVIKRYKK